MTPSNFFGWPLACALMLGITLSAVPPIGETPAAVLTVPNALATAEGNSNNAVPFTFASRYQEVFAASQFSTLSGPALITTMSFRPDAVFGRSFSATIPNIQISLSTTKAAPDALNPIFANNIGVDGRVVFSGSLFLSSAFTGPATGPKDFDISIVLQSPFLYDPHQGNLLLDVKNFTDNFASVPVLDAQNVVGDSISRLWNDLDVNSDTAFFANGNPDDFSNSLGLVTQFTFVVPGPASLVLVLAGLVLAGLGGVARAAAWARTSKEHR